MDDIIGAYDRLSEIYRLYIESTFPFRNSALDDERRIILSKPRAIPAVIVIFGLTPLPDSLLMVPLGLAEYDIKKTFIWMFFSRILMISFYAIIGIFAITWLIGAGDDPFGWVLGVVFLYVLWIIIAVMMKYKPKAKPAPKIENKDSD